MDSESQQNESVETVIILSDTVDNDECVEITDVANGVTNTWHSVINLSDDDTNQQETSTHNTGNSSSSKTASIIVIDDSVQSIADLNTEKTPFLKRKFPEVIDLCNSTETISERKKSKKMRLRESGNVISMLNTNTSNNNNRSKKSNTKKRHNKKSILNFNKKITAFRIAANNSTELITATSTPKASTLSSLPAKFDTVESYAPNKELLRQDFIPLIGSRPVPTSTNVTNAALPSHTSNVGYNIYNPNVNKVMSGLRPIIIDGSNVAVQHGIAKGSKDFSVAGIEICIEYFEKRGHTVKTFIPHFRLLSNASTNHRRLQELEKNGKVICTPSRNIRGKTVSSYDDRYIVQTAVEFGGVIVSNDNYRDLIIENHVWRETIERRLLMFTWVGDCLIFPLDPLGRHGPSLEQFLRF